MKQKQIEGEFNCCLYCDNSRNPTKVISTACNLPSRILKLQNYNTRWQSMCFCSICLPPPRQCLIQHIHFPNYWQFYAFYYNCKKTNKKLHFYGIRAQGKQMQNYVQIIPCFQHQQKSSLKNNIEICHLQSTATHDPFPIEMK